MNVIHHFWNSVTSAQRFDFIWLRTMRTYDTFMYLSWIDFLFDWELNRINNEEITLLRNSMVGRKYLNGNRVMQSTENTSIQRSPNIFDTKNASTSNDINNGSIEWLHLNESANWHLQRKNVERKCERNAISFNVHVEHQQCA